MTKTYADIGRDVGVTVQEKQAAYGDSFGKSGEVMRILYPDGIPPSKLDDALTVVRVLDKLFRIATDRDALGESPWRDIAGYALLSVARQEKQKAGDNKLTGTNRCAALFCPGPKQDTLFCESPAPHTGSHNARVDGKLVTW